MNQGISNQTSGFDRTAGMIQGSAIASYLLSRLGFTFDQIDNQVNFHDSPQSIIRAAILAELDPHPVPGEAYLEYMVGIRQSDLDTQDLWDDFCRKVWDEFKASNPCGFSASLAALSDPRSLCLTLGQLLVLRCGSLEENLPSDDDADHVLDDPEILKQADSYGKSEAPATPSS